MTGAGAGISGSLWPNMPQTKSWHGRWVGSGGVAASMIAWVAGVSGIGCPSVPTGTLWPTTPMSQRRPPQL